MDAMLFKSVRGFLFAPRHSSGPWAWCLAVGLMLVFAAGARAGEAPVAILPVAEVKPGMVGVGRTVLQRTQTVEFKVHIIGVMRGVRPGFDLVLCRCEGANLEKTGIIAGMSGSPVYIDGKLLGAIAFTWQFNKEPIGGITPFEQMQSFAASAPEQGAKIEPTAAGTVPLDMLRLDGDPFAGLRAAPQIQAHAAGGQTLPMQAIALPLAASGFAPQALRQLQQQLAPMGMVAMASGGAAADDVREPDPAIFPGGVLGASLVTGDMDLTGIGTVTHVDGDRVWGWGHPFLSGGKVGYVLRSGLIHTVNPKLDVSTKLGAPLGVRGVVQADVGTCIAGRLGQEPDLLPMRVTLDCVGACPVKTYEVQISRHPALIGSLVGAVLTSAIESQGAVEQEITIDLDATIRAEGLEPIVIKDRFSGADVAGSQGTSRLLNTVALIADRLVRNPFSLARLESIECHATIHPERRSAAITSMRLGSDRYQPGEELRAYVTLRPYKCQPRELELSLKLPASLPPGEYTVMACDATTHLRQLFEEEPQRLQARSLPELAEAFRLQLSAKREMLYLRVVTPDAGLAVGEVALPQLPASVRAAFASRRATETRPIRRALVSRQPAEWVIEGTSALRFRVVPDKHVVP